MLTANRQQRRTPPKQLRKSYKAIWEHGVTPSVPENSLRASLNVVYSQNGNPTPMQSLVPYGPTPIGTVLGEIGTFVKRTGTTIENYLISVQNVSGTAKVYVAKGEDNDWTEIDGFEFDTSVRCHFCPIHDIDANYEDEDKVLITNKSDYLAYLDINTLTVVTFTALGSSSINSLAVGTGLTGSTFTQRYRVTASNRGETAASTTVTATTTKIRDSWSAANEYIDVVINRVTGAARYHVYYGDTVGSESYLFSIDDPGTGSTVTWRDTGTVAPDPFRTAPLGDTTAGPICARAYSIDGRVFLLEDKDNPKYVRFGGTGTSVLDFSPYGGGGYQPVGGNKEFPVAMKAFRDNTGAPAMKVLCTGTTGKGKRYNFVPASLTVGTQTINYFDAREDNGEDGTDAPDTVAVIRDQLVYMSRDGAKTTFTKAQLQTILSTEGMTDAIQEAVNTLNRLTLEKAVGLVDQNIWYVALAVGSDTNNEIWALDFRDARKGAWLRPLQIAADWMWLYDDNSGGTHFCILSNNELFELTKTVATANNGVAFPTGITTGRLTFSEDGQEWGDVQRVVVVLQRPTGQIFVTLNGRTEDSISTPIGSQTFESLNDVVGWDEPNGWDAIYGWDPVVTAPTQVGVDDTEIEIEVGEEIKWFSADISSSAAGVDYEVVDIFAEYLPTGTKSNL